MQISQDDFFFRINRKAVDHPIFSPHLKKKVRHAIHPRGSSISLFRAKPSNSVNFSLDR
jgi:hypothetical protein